MAASTRVLPSIKPHELKNLYRSIVSLLHTKDESRRGEIAMLETIFMRYLRQVNFNADSLRSLLSKNKAAITAPGALTIIESIISDIKDHNCAGLDACYFNAFAKNQNTDEELKLDNQSQREKLTPKIWKSIFIASLIDFKLELQYRSAPSSFSPPVFLDEVENEFNNELKEWRAEYDKAQMHDLSEPEERQKIWQLVFEHASRLVNLAKIAKNTDLLQKAYKCHMSTLHMRGNDSYNHSEYQAYIHDYHEILRFMDDIDHPHDEYQKSIINSLIEMLNEVCNLAIKKQNWQIARLGILDAMQLCKKYSVHQHNWDLTRRNLALIKSHEATLHFSQDRIAEGKECLQAAIRLRKGLKDEVLLNDSLIYHDDCGGHFFKEHKWAAAKANFAITLFAAKNLKNADFQNRARQDLALVEFHEGVDLIERKDCVGARTSLNHAAIRFKFLQSPEMEVRVKQEQIKVEKTMGITHVQIAEALILKEKMQEAVKQYEKAKQCFDIIQLRLDELIKNPTFSPYIDTPATKSSLLRIKISQASLCVELNDYVGAKNYFEDALTSAKAYEDTECLTIAEQSLEHLEIVAQRGKASIMRSPIL